MYSCHYYTDYILWNLYVLDFPTLNCEPFGVKGNFLLRLCIFLAWGETGH